MRRAEIILQSVLAGLLAIGWMAGCGGAGTGGPSPAPGLPLGQAIALVGPSGKALNARVTAEVVEESGQRRCRVRLAAESLPDVAGFSARVEVLAGSLQCLAAEAVVAAGEKSIGCGEVGEDGREAVAAGASLAEALHELATFSFSGSSRNGRVAWSVRLYDAEGKLLARTADADEGNMRAAEAACPLGDLDGDGQATVGDAIKILRIAVGLDPGDPRADVNGSGTVDVGDAIRVLRCAVGLDPWPILRDGQVCFGGRFWDVKVGDGRGPGPNSWSAENVSVDVTGRLHLQIAQQDTKWTCAEVILSEPLGYGEYLWQRVQSDFAAMDPWTVLGIFIYRSDLEEIDALEVSRWGDPGSPPLFQHVVQPADCEAISAIRCHRFTCEATSVTISLLWTPGQVRVRVWNDDTGELISDWTYEGPEVPEPLEDTRARMNLWLFQGHQQIGKGDEVVIGDFQFGPVLRITSPSEGAQAGRFTTVSGVGLPGRTVEVRVLPEGDIWYYQGAVEVDQNGEWSLLCCIGDAATPSGLRFTIEAQSDDGQVVLRHVYRQ